MLRASAMERSFMRAHSPSVLEKTRPGRQDVVRKDLPRSLRDWQGSFVLLRPGNIGVNAAVLTWQRHTPYSYAVERELGSSAPAAATYIRYFLTPYTYKPTFRKQHV